MSTRFPTVLMVLSLSLGLGEARADFFGETLGFDSVSVPDDGKMIDVMEPDDHPDLTEMARAQQRSQALMRTIEHGELEHEPLRGYLQDLMDRIVEHSPYPSVRPRVHLISSVSPNAQAAPDGSVWIHVGILTNLKYEEQVAFVLAHEYGHILFEHWDSEWFERTQYYGVVAGRGVREMSRKVEAVTAEFRGVTSGIKGLEDLDRAIFFGSLAYKASTKVLAPAWEREQEDVADALGVDLMVRAGFHPSGANSFLKVLAEHEARALAEQKSQSEVDAERAEKMEQAFSMNGLGGVFEEAFSELSDILESEIDALGVKHYAAADRMVDLGTYVFNQYPMAGAPVETELPWVRDARHSVATLLDRHAAAYDAHQKLMEDDFDQSIRLARRAVSGVGSSMSYSRFIFHEIRRKQGDAAKAAQNLELAMDAPHPSIHVWIAHLRQAIDQAEGNAARTRLEEADRISSGSPQLLPWKIRIYGHFGDQEKVREAQMDCLDYQVQDFQESCSESYALIQNGSN